MSQDDNGFPKRLAGDGTDVERWLLRSAELDDDGADAAEDKTLERMLAEQRGETRGKPLRRLPALAVAGLAAAAALALWLNRARELRYNVAAIPSSERVVPMPQPSAVSSASVLREDPCAHPVKAEGTAPMIDDLEDRNSRILLQDGRDGFWSSFNDGTGTQQPASGAPWHPTLIPGGRGSSRYAMHTKGGVFTGWGVSSVVSLVENGCYDASAYAGVSFYARGPGRVKVFVQMSETVPVEHGGSCEHNCFDSHIKAVELGRRWQRYTVVWHELSQQGFGPPVTFDPKRLKAIVFGFGPEDTPFDYWIDDLSFVSR